MILQQLLWLCMIPKSYCNIKQNKKINLFFFPLHLGQHNHFYTHCSLMCTSKFFPFPNTTIVFTKFTIHHKVNLLSFFLDLYVLWSLLHSSKLTQNTLWSTNLYSYRIVAINWKLKLKQRKNMRGDWNQREKEKRNNCCVCCRYVFNFIEILLHYL